MNKPLRQMKVQMNQMIDLSRLQQALGNSPIGHTVHHSVTTPSTMLLAHQLCKQRAAKENYASGSAPSGAIVVAEEQTAGRGRHQRQWTMPCSSGLAVSICIKAPHLPANPAQLPMMTAAAAIRAMKSVIPARKKIELKWPNDLLIKSVPSEEEAIAQEESNLGRRRKFKKVGGILLESSFQQGQLAYAILGIGINVNQKAHELPHTPPGAPDATSIYAALGHLVDRTDLLILLCQSLSDLITDEPQNIYQEWRASLHTLGKPVSIQQQGRHQETNKDTLSRSSQFSRPNPDDTQIVGIAVDTTADGGLVIENYQGHRQTFYAGDVSVRSA